MDEPLKQRLVGALVVGTFAIVVVPWLLGEPEAPPAKRQLAPVNPVPAKPTPLPQPLPVTKREVSEPVVVTPSSTPLTIPDLPPAPTPANADTQAPAAGTPAAPIVLPGRATGAWQVQAASLSSEEGAARLVKRLQGASLDARAEQSGRFWRVYVVGFESREDADGARARLQLEFSLTGVIQRTVP